MQTKKPPAVEGLAWMMRLGEWSVMHRLQMHIS